MRIAYVCYWDVTRNDGVVRKIGTQLGYWRQFGHDAELFAVAPHTPLGGERRRALWLGMPKRQVARVRAMSRLADATRAYLPDVVYLRYDLFAPPIAGLLRGLPSVIEINTDDRAELRRRPAARIYNEYNRRSLINAARGIVCVTHELAASVLPFRKPTVVIANGIDVAEICPSAAHIPPRSRPRLVWLGTYNEPWHGLDKVVWLATQMSDCDFFLVGITGEALPQPVPRNIQTHGRLDRAEYDKLLRQGDVAIGTLALHRKNMNEASPLKVREYLAYGLPVIVAYEDTDFMGDRPWYLLRLPNSESNVRDHLAEIRAFVRSVSGKRVAREDIIDRVGAEGKEIRRMAFLEQVRRGPPGL